MATLTRRERAHFQAQKTRILRAVKPYGDPANKVGICWRITNGKYTFRVLGDSYSPQEIFWILHHNRFMTEEEKQEIDHICGDPHFTTNKEKKCHSKCVTLEHFMRSAKKSNLSRKHCHHVIRKWYFRIYRYRIKNLKQTDRLTPGPIKISDISDQDLSALYDLLYPPPSGAYKKSKQDERVRIIKKKQWIKKSRRCRHRCKCFMNFN